MSNPIAISCIQDLEAKVAQVAPLKGKTFHVYSEEELLERTKGIAFPCVGVVYDGMIAAGEAGASAKVGGSVELVASVIIFYRKDTKSQKDPKDTTVALLDSIRGKIMSTRGPSGHLWKFKMEVAIAGKAGILAYVQRWAIPVQLS